MLGNIGPGMLILIIIAALLLFGPNKLPELGRAFGKTLREFKNGAKDMMEGDDEPKQKPIEVQTTVRKEVGPEAAKKEDSRRLPD